MSYLNDFQYTADYPVGIKVFDVADGEHECIIQSAAETTVGGQFGSRAVEIKLDVKDSNGAFYTLTIKEGEKFNQQYSRFLDAFKLKAGALNTFIGAKGICNFWHSITDNGKKFCNGMPLPKKETPKAVNNIAQTFGGNVQNKPNQYQNNYQNNGNFPNY